jgi:hypothetical protein
MGLLRVRSTRAKDAEKLAPKLRQADIQEIQAATGESPLVALQNGISWSDSCYTIVDENDKPLALFGTVPDPNSKDTGRVWFLGSDELTKHSLLFLRNSHKWVEKLHQRYDILWNYIDARNEVHIRWLKWCGFKFIRRIEKYGVEQRPFYEFEKVRIKEG